VPKEVTKSWRLVGSGDDRLCSAQGFQVYPSLICAYSPALFHTFLMLCRTNQFCCDTYRSQLICGKKQMPQTEIANLDMDGVAENVEREEAEKNV
jgi:hypothetical protein